MEFAITADVDVELITPTDNRSWEPYRNISDDSRDHSTGDTMPFRWNPREHVSLTVYFMKWVLIASPVSAMIGSAVALFLWALDLATRTRWNHPSLLFCLPLAGVG